MPRVHTILCVDDSPALLETIRAILEASDYRVLTAGNGADALRLLDSHSVDLVVADYQMPGISGAEVAAAAKERSPDLRVVLFTGYAGSLSPQAWSVADRVVTKGTMTSLLREVRELLAGYGQASG